MLPLLLGLTLLGLGQAPTPAATVDQWRSLPGYDPAYESLCHFDPAARMWIYSAVRKVRPKPAPVNYGVTLGAERPAGVSEVRGTDPDLARDLAQTVVSVQSRARAKAAEASVSDRPCPGPGPCPRPDVPDVPDPFGPDVPPAPPLNVGLLAVAGGLVLLALFLVAILFTLVLSSRKAHP